MILGLIVVETALAVVLLTSGGLLLQTFQHLRDTDLGMQSEKLLTFVTSLFRYHDFDRRVAFVNAVLESIRVIPGVVNAGASSQIPLKVMDPQATFYWLAGQSQDRIPGQVALMRVVTRDYFRTIGGRLREGRFFENSYRRSESPVAIVNESFANRNFPGRSAIGARFKFVASLGLYGVLSYAVTQRTNEIGVRMALGATSKDILLSFGGRGLKLTLAGLAVGLVLAVIAARFMTTLLYGFRPDYVPTLAVVSLIFLAVAALASLVPARRAAKVNSMETLRYE